MFIYSVKFVMIVRANLFGNSHAVHAGAYVYRVNI